jgi:cytochrome c oxidase subunit 2
MPARQRRPSRPGKSVVAVLALAALVIVLTGCHVPSFGLPHPATKQGQHTAALWKGVVITALCVGVLVWGLITYSIVRYRRRDRDGDGIPSQRQYHIPLEIVYTVVPIVMVFGLFFFAVATEHQVDHKTPHPAVNVTVLGFQWQWQFRYPASNITVTGNGAGPYPELVVPAGKVVQADLVSADVVHSFWVPRFLFKRDLIPGVHNVVQFTVRSPGRYRGECAAFCGLDHARMDFWVHALTPADYDRWVARNHGKSLTPGGENVG